MTYGEATLTLYNLVRCYTTTTGQGDITIGSAVPGFLTFAQANVTNGSTVSYGIKDGNYSEVGTGVYTSSTNTLTRNVLASNDGGNKLFLSGLAEVYITVLAEDIAFTFDDLTDGTTNKAFTSTEKTKLSGIEAGAEVNNISDVNALELTDGGTTNLHTHSGFGDISGAGVVGQVAEFVTDTKTLQAAKLIAPTTNILTLTNAAASTLALNITAGKTLTLTAADNYTLTIPATGTAALLGTANVFTAQQMVDGTSDQIQLRVQGHSTQTSQVFTVEANDGTAYFNVGSDGRVRMGISNYANTTNCLQVAYGTNTSGTKTSIYSEVTDNGATTTTYGFQNNTLVNASVNKTSGIVSGVNGSCIPNTITAGISVTSGAILSAFLGRAYCNANMAGTIASLSAYRADLWGFGPSNPAGVVTNLYGALFDSPSTTSSGGGSITNIYGLYINNIAGGTNSNYAIYTNSGLNRLGDQLSVTGIADRNQLKVTGFTTQTLPVGYLIDNTAATNTVRNVLQLETQSTGTAANGLGAGLLFSIETATASTMQTGGVISASWVDATNATRKAKLSLSAYDTAARLGLEIEASGTEPKIGFYGVAPIARAVLATGASATVDDVITALQNLGLVKQS